MAITSQIRNRYMFFDFENCPNFVFLYIHLQFFGEIS